MGKLGIFGLVFVGFFAGVVFGDGSYDGGSGTAADPYQIRTAEQLHALSLHSEDWDKCFLMTADIDMDPAVTGISAYTNSLIGTSVKGGTSADFNPFTGTFDGDRYSIKNLMIVNSSKSYMGLFGYIDGGTVKNLGVENIKVEGDYYVGGLVGYNNGTISQSFAEGEVVGQYDVAGFVGCNIGYIYQCYSSGLVKAIFTGAGFAGRNFDTAAILKDCYSNSNLTVLNYPWNPKPNGGFVGHNQGQVNKCYSTGSIKQQSTGEIINAYGFAVGNHHNPVIDCFWDVSTSEITSDLHATGLDNCMMKSMRFFSLAGWSGDVWVIDEGNDYPRLAWEGSEGVPIAEYVFDLKGSGTKAYPYQIRTASDLRLMSYDILNLRDKHFILMNDIDVQSSFLIPIGLYIENIIPFTGSFDGNRHVIYNLTITKHWYAGLFTLLDVSAEVKELGLENINIVANGYQQIRIGGLAGVNAGSVNQCYVTGEINASGMTGDYMCGGLLGANDGIVRDCYSKVNISVKQNETSTRPGIVGGLIGYNSGEEVNRCYSAGKVELIGYGDVCGLIGKEGSQENCAINSFFDSSNNPELYCGGRSTLMMQQEAIYKFGGWGNGLWTLDIGNDYPHLAWECAEGVVIEPPVGDGSMENPYEISNAYELAEIGRQNEFLDKSFLLTADIDMDPNVTGIPVFDRAVLGRSLHSEYRGVFDGNGHVISNLMIEPSLESANRMYYIGFFGISNLTIKNLGLENVSIKGNSRTGGLVGLLNGEIINCYTTGTLCNPKETAITTLSTVGGLVGWNNGGSIRNCYSSCDITDAAFAGGIAGFSYYYSMLGGIDYGTEIKNCYSAGNISGDKAGGIVGKDRDGVYINCIWDSTVNPGLSDCGYDYVADAYNVDLASVEGVSSDEMMMAGTFTNAGWDFVGEGVNGELDVWRLCEDGSGYPRLAWEYSSRGDFVCGDGVDMNDFAYFAERYLSDGCGGIFDVRYGVPHSSSGAVDLSLFAKLSECWMRPMNYDCRMIHVGEDDVINEDDLTVLIEQWLCRAPVNWDRADLDGDGVVGILDFAEFCSHWLE